MLALLIAAQFVVAEGFTNPLCGYYDCRVTTFHPFEADPTRPGREILVVVSRPYTDPVTGETVKVGAFQVVTPNHPRKSGYFGRYPEAGICWEGLGVATGTTGPYTSFVLGDLNGDGTDDILLSLETPTRSRVTPILTKPFLHCRLGE